MRFYCHLAVLAGLVLAPTALRAEVPTEKLLREGVAAFERGDYQLARKHMRALAAREVAAAEVLLGTMAANGQGGPREPAIAAAWYLGAARRGHPAAQLALSHAFATGTGVPQNRERALALARAAAARQQNGAEELVAILTAPDMAMRPDKPKG